MLSLFFLLALGFHQNITKLDWDYAWAILALCSSFVAATTINDINDKDIDTINHPKNQGRPLVTGAANIRDLYQLHFLAMILSLGFAFLISWEAVGIIAVSLLINYLYSAKPFRLSYQTYLAPILLTMAYVGIPYWLGLLISNAWFTDQDYFFLGALMTMFLGRIILKDFRDRKGDALYGKQTFLLRHGKTATCAVSVISILAGNLLLLATFAREAIWLMLLMQFYFLAIFFILWKLFKTADLSREQIAIAIGAKMGNGLLLTTLGILILIEYSAPIATQVVYATVLIFLFLVNLILLLRSPEYALTEYRG